MSELPVGYQNPSKINLLVIHCTATPNGRVTSNEDIDQWHKAAGFKRNPKLIGCNEPSLKHIGYHYVIHTNGSVRIGRAQYEMGAHAYPKNRNSIGVALVGTDKFSKQQWHALKALVRTLFWMHNGLSMLGHNSINPNKTCPGFSVDNWRESGMAAPDNHVLT